MDSVKGHPWSGGACRAGRWAGRCFLLEHMKWVVGGTEKDGRRQSLRWAVGGLGQDTSQDSLHPNLRVQWCCFADVIGQGACPGLETDESPPSPAYTWPTLTACMLGTVTSPLVSWGPVPWEPLCASPSARSPPLPDEGQTTEMEVAARAHRASVGIVQWTF